MSYNSKIHLVLPDETNVCLHRGSNKTKKINEATCLHCKNSIKNNKGWYKAQWENHERQNEKVYTWPNPSEMTNAILRGVEQMKSIAPSPNEIRKSLGLSSGCDNCSKPIRTMCFKGTNHCSENCRKDLLKEAS